MYLGGELVSLIVSLAQEVGIIVGVGAVTLTLIGHLLSLHAKHNEVTRGYVRAAHHLRAAALFVIVVSGVAAVALHLVGGSAAVLLVPAFVFKWLLIALIIMLHFTEWRVTGLAQDATEGFEGATWYALFIVHTLAPAVSWMFLGTLYAGWVATFAVIWGVFVWIMRGQSTHKPAAPAVSKPVVPARHLEPKVENKSVPALVHKPAPPPVVQKPVPPPQPQPAPVVAPTPVVVKPTPKVEVHPNHTLLPMIAELDLPAPRPHAAEPPKPPAPAPLPVPPPHPAPAPAPVPPPPVMLVPEFSNPPVPMTELNETGLPALHVMPKRPEDIEGSKRGPVVKMGEE